MNSTNSSIDPMEKLVLTATTSRRQGDRPGEVAPGRRGEERIAGEERENAAQLILEEQADEHARDERAQDAHFLKHLADAEPLGRRFGLRETAGRRT